MSWKDDDSLKNFLKDMVRRNYSRREVLDYAQRDFPNYKWSLRSLERRLKNFNVRYIDYGVPINEVKAVVEMEVGGPGGKLGYRSLHKKIREKYKLNVPRDLVHNVMFEVDPAGLATRKPNTKKKKKGYFTSPGPNWVLSMDGHDKLMGYQNWTFPLAIYGCMDTCSRKILWLKVWNTNSKPEIIGKWFLDYLHESKVRPKYIRIDRGTETGDMAAIQAFLSKDDPDLNSPTDSVIFGPSTSNQIERWWRELHERLEGYFKEGLLYLKDTLYYDPSNVFDRSILAFVLVPIVQRELDEFRELIWNSHRIRYQKNTLMPDGVPNHIYDFPEVYGLKEHGIPLDNDALEEITLASGLLNVSEDFMDPALRIECEAIYPGNIATTDFIEAYKTLRRTLAV